MSTNLHAGFREPTGRLAGALASFLEDVDRLPALQAIRAAMRRALDIRPGMRVLDAGCGLGLETARLAADHPDAEFTGVDRNADLLQAARLRAEGNEATLERSLPQPWAGRRLPEALADRGVAELDAAPYSFTVDEGVWRRIVGDTLMADADAGDQVSTWIDDVPRRGLLGAFTGILTTARVAC